MTNNFAQVQSTGALWLQYKYQRKYGYIYNHIQKLHNKKCEQKNIYQRIRNRINTIYKKIHKD